MSYLDSQFPVLNQDRREPEIQQSVTLFKGMTDESAIAAAIERVLEFPGPVQTCSLAPT